MLSNFNTNIARFSQFTWVHARRTKFHRAKEQVLQRKIAKKGKEIFQERLLAPLKPLFVFIDEYLSKCHRAQPTTQCSQATH